MRVVVTYDVSEDRVRTKVAELMQGMLTRVQYSVFEGEVPEERLRTTIRLAAGQIDGETDSIRVYRLCASCLSKVDVHGRSIEVVPKDVRVL